MADTHTVMPRKLAQALIEAGMKHFDAGGVVPPVQAPQGVGPTPTSAGSTGFFGTLAGQSGYNAVTAPTQESDYGGLISTAAGNALNGYGTANQIQGQQQNLAKTLLAESQGQGPNPAAAALAQETGQNVNNQAALMAGQRGASSNVGLIARQAAQQGAATQQQAVGQAATLQAQQQLTAQQELQQQQAAMASENEAEQGINTNLLATGASAQNAQNNTNVSNYGMAQGIDANVAQNNSKNASGLLGGVINGVAGALALYKGGEVPSHLHKLAKIYHPAAKAIPENFQAGGKVPGSPAVNRNSSKNDVVPAVLSPKEVVLPLSVTQAKNAPQKAAEFLKHLQKHSSKKDDDAGYEKVVKSRQKRR